MTATQFDTTEELEKRLEDLQDKWDIDIKSKDRAGGNSGDNYERMQIMVELRDRKKNV